MHATQMFSRSPLALRLDSFSARTTDGAERPPRRVSKENLAKMTAKQRLLRTGDKAQPERAAEHCALGLVGVRGMERGRATLVLWDGK